jgi:hypothetical protein
MYSPDKHKQQLLPTLPLMCCQIMLQVSLTKYTASAVYHGISLLMLITYTAQGHFDHPVLDTHIVFCSSFKTLPSPSSVIAPPFFLFMQTLLQRHLESIFAKLIFSMFLALLLAENKIWGIIFWTTLV